MRKILRVIRDDKGLAIDPEVGFIVNNGTFRIKDPKQLVQGIFGLLGIGGDYTVILRRKVKL